MSYIPSFLLQSGFGSITLTPGVLSASTTFGFTVNPAFSVVTLYAISTNSAGDLVGASDMGAEGYVTLDNATAVSAHRVIDNAGVTTTYFFIVHEFHPSFFPGVKNLVFGRGKLEPGATGVLPNSYQSGWQTTTLLVK